MKLRKLGRKIQVPWLIHSLPGMPMWLGNKTKKINILVDEEVSERRVRFHNNYNYLFLLY